MESICSGFVAAGSETGMMMKTLLLHSLLYVPGVSLHVYPKRFHQMGCYCDKSWRNCGPANLHSPRSTITWKKSAANLFLSNKYKNSMPSHSRCLSLIEHWPVWCKHKCTEVMAYRSANAVNGFCRCNFWHRDGGSTNILSSDWRKPEWILHHPHYLSSLSWIIL